MTGNGGSTGIAALLEGRKAILIDDSPLATNMEYNMFNYVDMDLLEIEYKITNNYHISETLDDFYSEVIDRHLSNTFE